MMRKTRTKMATETHSCGHKMSRSKIISHQIIVPSGTTVSTKTKASQGTLGSPRQDDGTNGHSHGDVDVVGKTGGGIDLVGGSG